MESSRRVQRLEKELRLAISSFLLTGFKYHLSGLITIQRVIASRDLKSAKVYISVLGNEEEQGESVATVQEHTREIQAHIAHTLKLRYTPKLSFFADHMTEKIMKVEQVLRELKGERNSSDDEGKDEE